MHITYSSRVQWYSSSQPFDSEDQVAHQRGPDHALKGPASPAVCSMCRLTDLNLIMWCELALSLRVTVCWLLGREWWRRKCLLATVCVGACVRVRVCARCCLSPAVKRVCVEWIMQRKLSGEVDNNPVFTFHLYHFATLAFLLVISSRHL